MTTAHASTAQVGAVSATTNANNRGRTTPAVPAREWLRKTALRLALASVLVFCLLPIAFLVATSFKTRDEVLSGHFLPLAPTLANWSTVFDIAPLHRNLLNSLAVALVSLAVTLLIAVPATYAVVKLRRGPALAGALLSSYVAPPVVALLPLFFMMRHAGLNNSILGLGLVEGLMNVPVAFWLLRSFFKQVPVALDEAAWLDGVGYWRTLWRVNLPLLWPGLVSTGLICLILTYNEFLLASVLNSRPDIRTITVAISLFQGERVVNFGQMAAASLVGIAPVYLVALAFQKQLVGGLGAGR
ncbi:multiple sugar transport system permease protein [Variovorax boronicumulans]|uniref:Multiple sugar transport system permease protein n=1 Tax=Variovorax boronicumulans TaxID=436515 RepID=A0AAW8D1H1_9BURK|nr:carbohydrate ABC transporter permease [Variovorax boronicumulans]MDP9893802.1 multiple sugar transport system permease protein [Variovorax boronicumulans]MDQ0053619.1 multiple sugar transport system permease protein [Variovorax boronicumulans]